MKKALLIFVVIVGLVMLVVSVPVLAHGPDDGVGAPSEQSWEAMYEACQNGDWDAMAEAAEEFHGEDFGLMHGDGEGMGTHMGGMSGHMSGGMMGWH